MVFIISHESLDSSYMIALIISILSSIAILLAFKVAERIKIDIFYIIVINYFTATVCGLLLNNIPVNAFKGIPTLNFILAFIIGFLFIIMFFAIGISTQKVGISVTSVAAKMSVIIPMTFSIFYFSESVGDIKIIGIITALAAVFLSVYKKRSKNINAAYIYLPLLLFVGIGTIDLLVKYSQQELITSESLPLFTASSFFMAFVCGIMMSFFKKVRFRYFFKTKNIVLGLILGIANFGSMYFLIKALSSNVFDSSIIFAINNIGIIVGSVILAIIIFKEKINKLNWVGIGLSIIGIVLLAKA